VYVCVCLIGERIAYTNGRRKRRPTGNGWVRAVQQCSGCVGACVLVYCRRAAGHIRGGTAAALKAPRKEKYRLLIIYVSSTERARFRVSDPMRIISCRRCTRGCGDYNTYIYTLYISQRRRFRLYYII